MYVYCLECDPHLCRAIASELEERGTAKRAFSPQILQHTRLQGQNVEAIHDLLPGYVFVYSDVPLEDFEAFRGIEGIIRRVGPAENGFALTGTDLGFAMGLYDRDGLVGKETLRRDGDQVLLEDPLFINSQGRITGFDYRKRRARVDYVFAGKEQYTWIAFEMINSVE